jgi:hypothetical protein
MYNNDSNSLNAGAPDIRLSGNQQMASDPNPEAEWRQLYENYKQESIQQNREYIDFEGFIEMHREHSRAPQQNSGIMAAAPQTYTQNRKRQMAAGGGIMGSNNGSMLVAPTADGTRPGYGFLSDLKDKFVDDIIPNEIKENPMAAAALLGLGANQFDLIPGEMSSQNWLGDLLGGRDAVLGPGGSGDKLIDFGNIFNTGSNLNKASNVLTGGGINPADPSTWENLNKMVNDPTGALKNAALAQFQKLQQQQNPGSGSGIMDKFSSVLSPYLGEGEGRRVNPLYPIGIGAGVGKYVSGLPKDTLPMDTTSIDPAAIATAARGTDAQGAAAGLRFLPEQATRAAEGGRMGYEDGGLTEYQLFKLKELGYGNAGSNPGSYGGIGVLKDILKVNKYAQGGRIGAEEGGLMNLGGMEKDYRAEGGFVPIGGKEKADDVPARLSKNEFVFTADAVRGAGGGDIDKGAEIMENMMKSLEAGGEVSEESQGLEGARGMFANAQQLQKRII